MIGLEKTTEAGAQEIIRSEQVAIDVVRWNAMSIEAEQIAGSIVIVDEESNTLAVDCLAKIKKFGKDVEAARVQHVSPFNTLVTRINGIFKPITGSISAAETTIKKKMVDYANEQEKKRRAEEERIRKENEARRLQADEEHRKQLEAARLEAERTKKPVEAPKYVAPVEAAIPKQQTVSAGFVGKTTLVSTWKGSVVDAKAVVKAIADGLLPIELVEFRQIELNRYAKDVGIEGVWSGVKVVEEKGIKAR